MGPEAAARAARYAVLEQIRESFDADVVLLGHTRDDQAETVLLGLARGSGGRALAGMRPSFDAYRRPLLDVSHTDTVTACQVEGLRVWDDPHNDDPSFTRVRVRRRVLPVLEDELGPGVTEALARTAEQLRPDMELLDAYAERALADLGGSPTDGLPVDRARRPGGPDPDPCRCGSPPSPPAPRPASSSTSTCSPSTPSSPTGTVRAGSTCPATCAPYVGRASSSSSAPLSVLRMDAAQMENDLVNILFTEAQIQARLQEMADEIAGDYEGKDLLLVGILRGAVMVMADLSRALPRHVEMDWIAISSYGSGTKSSGVVRLLKDLDTDITGRHVLIVDEIVDTGLTLSWLVNSLGSRNAASVEIATLLRKPEALTMPVEPRYIGWDIPNEFVVGYGLDYREKYRNLRDIGTLAPHVYSLRSSHAGVGARKRAAPSAPPTPRRGSRAARSSCPRRRRSPGRPMVREAR